MEQSGPLASAPSRGFNRVTSFNSATSRRTSGDTSGADRRDTEEQAEESIDWEDIERRAKANGFATPGDIVEE